MKISVIGTGCVGSVTGVGLADLGHRITFMRRDRKNFEIGLEDAGVGRDIRDWITGYAGRSLE